MPDIREEFEKWAASHFIDVGSGNPLKKGPNGHYGFYVVATAWKSWQASRAALRVELPAKRSYSMYATKHECHAFNDAIEKANEALQQAGIEVKQ
ncbi:TPA: hypothetical protein ACPHXD_000280 [Pseudomonas aeruginosa]|uniref:Uncharacterized protein n=1 Tax=Pseudomonas aeruginosa TaxID=287 RepID=A0A367M5S4_PSEAI|nr:hypothetical protein [Pseudomonas aeruginosa]RCI41465.1 hypothetical protein DT380_03725 [Pseudomonas aeruginosa]RCI43091.1 hypothetical protein DT384_31525 [Pseudomonas aeruginosa]RCI72865.1 hypothetical protein DT376_21435 [Pseudomonas aeruginosa]RPO48079.1 hypothetical protein IPC1191_00575 [Pseudomonas aeruginosa]RPO59367.1 hypothetical protein IPC1190_00575 [Pseudomonas aeruginosa]